MKKVVYYYRNNHENAVLFVDTKIHHLPSKGEAIYYNGMHYWVRDKFFNYETYTIEIYV